MTVGSAKRIGVLAVQGGFAAHARALRDIGHEAVEVRTPEDLETITGLIFPGGESTVHLKLIDRFGLDGPLRAFAAAGNPILATCAGLILAARRVRSPEQPSFGFLDVEVDRNAYGRQRDSFEATDDSGRYSMVLIRAPRIVAVDPTVRVLATFRGEPVLVRQGQITGATFHPELTDDRTLHREVFGGTGKVAAKSAAA
ncbi:Pyridoxine biosynthesis glutamine amidotransferase, glutaminase subunit protein [Minicystis rosea]|nr:Pyridoxine biosynthesis glutamine amidotransferase, glutaminase subunit protein [Minicystis rosea]